MTEPSQEATQREHRGPIAFMAGHSVAANLIMLMCLIGGFLAFRNIKQEVFPEIDRDTVTVSVAYPGASPEEVESGIVLVIEEAVRGLDGVKEVTSEAREGSGAVTVEALLGADLQQLAQDIQSEIDRVRTFPDEAEEPSVRISSFRRDVLSLVIFGQVPDTVLLQLAERARDQLLQSPEITQIEVSGLPPLEISIEISEANLRRYGLTLREVARRLGDAAIDLPGGGIKTASGEILVRVKERRDYGREFGELPIVTTADGSEVLLRDVARIDDGFEDSDRYSRHNGFPAVSVEIYRIGDETPISVSDAVRAELDDLRSWLPPGIGVDIVGDRSEIYRQRIELLLRNGCIGLVLVMILLGVFLEARLAFWVMMGIPISFMGSFLVLPLTGVSINMISLFAYIIALGIVVDDAIVVGENIYHYHQEGYPFLEAARKGAMEVAMPVVFSILTNMVTFIPLALVPGTMGKIFKMIPVVVCTVFLLSLFESLFVLPAHLGHRKEHKQRRGFASWLHHRQQAFSHWFRHWVRDRYGPFLSFLLNHRYLTISSAASILMLAVSFALSGRMGMELFPTVESDRSEATLVMPYGTAVARTEAIARRLEQAAQQVIAESGHPELAEAITTDIGSGGSHICRVRVELAEPDIREKIMGTAEFTERWRQATGEVAGTEYLRFSAESGGPGGRGRPIAIELSHRSTKVLEQASAELAEALETYPLVKDVDDGYQPGKQQLDFTVKPEGKSLGLTAREIASQIRNALYGAEVLRQQRGRNEIKVMVRLPETDRNTEQTIHDFLVRTPAGTDVPLREVAEVKRGRAYTTINRRNGRRVVVPSADIIPRSKANEVLADLQREALPRLMNEYPGLSYSFEGHQADMRESVGSLKVTFALALLAIYALLAIPFRSYLQPFIVMVSIPFGIVGALIGHLIMGYSLSLMSMFGIVALSGVVVNDSLVMIDFANRLRRDNPEMTGRTAVHTAAIQRFRPIMLTTLTTFGGLSPMIFETSRQARFLIPMALSLGFGILFATTITLVLVPSLYVATEDFRKGARAFFGLLRS
jgi:multidrug efflux pump subunit AcrB